MTNTLRGLKVRLVVAKDVYVTHSESYTVLKWARAFVVWPQHTRGEDKMPFYVQQYLMA